MCFRSHREHMPARVRFFWFQRIQLQFPLTISTGMFSFGIDRIFG